VFIAQLLFFLDCNFKVIAVLENVLVVKWMSSGRAAMTVLPEIWGKLEESCSLSSQSQLRAMCICDLLLFICEKYLPLK